MSSQVKLPVYVSLMIRLVTSYLISSTLVIHSPSNVLSDANFQSEVCAECA